MSETVDTIRATPIGTDSAEFAGLAGSRPVWFHRTRGADDTAAMVRRVLAAGFAASAADGTTFTRTGAA